MEQPTAPGADRRCRSRRLNTTRCAGRPAVFTDAFAMLRPVRTRIEGRPVTPPSSPETSSRCWGPGGARSAVDAGRRRRSAGRPVIVLSHREWNKLFAGDPVVIGRSCRQRTAVRDRRRHARRLSGARHRCARLLGALALAGTVPRCLRRERGEIAIDVIGRLKPGMSAAAAAAGLTVWASGRTGLETVPGRPASIRLRPSQGTSL